MLGQLAWLEEKTSFQATKFSGLNLEAAKFKRNCKVAQSLVVLYYWLSRVGFFQFMIYKHFPVVCCVLKWYIEYAASCMKLLLKTSCGSCRNNPWVPKGLLIIFPKPLAWASQVQKWLQEHVEKACLIILCCFYLKHDSCQQILYYCHS